MKSYRQRTKVNESVYVLGIARASNMCSDDVIARQVKLKKKKKLWLRIFIKVDDNHHSCSHRPHFPLHVFRLCLHQMVHHIHTICFLKHTFVHTNLVQKHHIHSKHTIKRCAVCPNTQIRCSLLYGVCVV